MALLLVIPWLERVRCAIGCELVGGVAALITLEDGSPTVGASASVCALITLGGDAPTVGAGVEVCTPALEVGAGVGASWMLGGPLVGRLKME